MISVAERRFSILKMVTAWIYNENDDSDPRNPHKHEPEQPVSLQELASLGVKHWTFDPETEMTKVDELAKIRKYSSRDIINIAPDTLPDYENKLKIFFTEHLHDDEEIRYVLSGAGYFDIRNKKDQWVRIHTCKGDMIVLPAGSYHRFILDSTNYIKAMRLFKEDPSVRNINCSGLHLTVPNPRLN